MVVYTDFQLVDQTITLLPICQTKRASEMPACFCVSADVSARNPGNAANADENQSRPAGVSLLRHILLAVVKARSSNSRLRLDAFITWRCACSVVAYRLTISSANLGCSSS